MFSRGSTSRGCSAGPGTVVFHQHNRDESARLAALLFEELIADEEGHIDFLETQLSLQAELGEAVYGQLQAKPTDDSK